MLESLRLDGGEQFEDMLAPLSIDGGDEAADDRTLLCDTECIEDLFFSPAMRVDEDSGDIILSECCTDRNTDRRDGAEFDSGGDGMIEIDEISFHVLVEEMLESLRLDGGEQFEDMLAPLSIDGGDEAAD